MEKYMREIGRERWKHSKDEKTGKEEHEDSKKGREKEGVR